MSADRLNKISAEFESNRNFNDLIHEQLFTPEKNAA